MIWAPYEDIAHACEVVKDNRYDKRNRGCDEVINAKDVGEQQKQAIVDAKSNDAHDAEFHELHKQLFQVPFHSSQL